MEHFFIIITILIHICDSSKITIFGNTDTSDRNESTTTQRYCSGRKRRKKHEIIIITRL